MTFSNYFLIYILAGIAFVFAYATGLNSSGLKRIIIEFILIVGWLPLLLLAIFIKILIIISRDHNGRS